MSSDVSRPNDVWLLLSTPIPKLEFVGFDDTAERNFLAERAFVNKIPHFYVPISSNARIACLCFRVDSSEIIHFVIPRLAPRAFGP